LGNDGSWQAVSGSGSSNDTGSTLSTTSATGGYSDPLPGGTFQGSMTLGGTGNTNYTVQTVSTLNADGTWATTGTADDGGGGTSISSDAGSGAYVTGGDLSGSSGDSGGVNTVSGTLTASATANSSYNFGRHFTLNSDGTWQAVSGSLSSSLTVIGQYSDSGNGLVANTNLTFGATSTLNSDGTWGAPVAAGTLGTPPPAGTGPVGSITNPKPIKLGDATPPAGTYFTIDGLGPFVAGPGGTINAVPGQGTAGNPYIGNGNGILNIPSSYWRDLNGSWYWVDAKGLVHPLPAAPIVKVGPPIRMPPPPPSRPAHPPGGYGDNIYVDPPDPRDRLGLPPSMPRADGPGGPQITPRP